LRLSSYSWCVTYHRIPLSSVLVIQPRDPSTRVLGAESRASNKRGAVCKMHAVLANERRIPVETSIHCTSRKKMYTKALGRCALHHRELKRKEVVSIAYKIISRLFLRRVPKTLWNSEVYQSVRHKELNFVPGIGLENLPFGRFVGRSKQRSATTKSKDRSLYHEGDRIIAMIGVKRVDDCHHLQTARQLRSE
jgi:hypothetical protein